MAGPSGSLPEAWQLLRKPGPNNTKGLTLENPKTGDCRYLGCEHKYSSRPLPKYHNFLVEIKQPTPKKPKPDDGGEGNLATVQAVAPTLHKKQIIPASTPNSKVRH